MQPHSPNRHAKAIGIEDRVDHGRRERSKAPQHTHRTHNDTYLLCPTVRDTDGRAHGASLDEEPKTTRHTKPSEQRQGPFGHLDPRALVTVLVLQRPKEQGQHRACLLEHGA